LGFLEEIVRMFKPLTRDGYHVPPQHVKNLVGLSLAAICKQSKPFL